MYTSSTTESVDLAHFNLLTQENARTALDTIDSLLDNLALEKSSIGSMMSRLDITRSNLAAARENFRAAESRITDIDVANETSTFVRSQILQQAGASVLSQANLLPEVALQLLQSG